MYKEIIMRKKVSTIFIILVMISISIVISDIIETFTYEEYRIGKYLTIMVAIGTFVFSIRQVKKCKVKYKYSIIVDEFIIHKIKGTKNQTMECVKLKDIEYIKAVEKRKVLLDTIRYRVYGCLNFDNKLYFCKYSNDSTSKSFYFEASPILVDKLYLMKDKQ